MTTVRRLVFPLLLLIIATCGAPSETSNKPLAQTDDTIKLYALDCGSLIMQANAFDSTDSFSDDELRYLVVPCYLIRHPKGDFMWDAGLPDAMHDQPVIAPMLKDG